MDIIAFGDSITFAPGYGGGWLGRIKAKHESSGYYVYNLGIDGDDTNDILNRLESEFRERVDEGENYLLLIAIGINDSRVDETNTITTPLDKFKKNIQKIIDVSNKLSKNLVFVGLTPVDDKLSSPFYVNERVKEYDDALKQICNENKTFFIDIFSKLSELEFSKLLEDGLHPNSDGYDKMFEIISGFLKDKEFI